MDKVNYDELHAETPDRKNTKKSYQSPRLSAYGDIRDLTLGASPGGGDSLDPLNLQGPV